MMQFLEDASNDGECIHIKAGIVFAYYSLSWTGMLGLKCEDLEFNESNGMWVSYKILK